MINTTGQPRSNFTTDSENGKKDKNLANIQSDSDLEAAELQN